MYSQEIEKFINEAEHGVIFMSFGSIVKGVRLSPEVIAMFADIFEALPQRVIWKHDEEIKRSKNVLVSKWWPQRDILGSSVAIQSHVVCVSVYLFLEIIVLD